MGILRTECYFKYLIIVHSLNMWTLVYPLGDTSTKTLVPDNDWQYDFVVPWEKMPASFMKKTKSGERLSCSERRQLVRTVASEILEVSKCPTKKHVSEIAR